MAIKIKACAQCRRIYEGDKCPACGETVTSETIKGKVYIFDTDKSDVAKNMKINKPGEYAIKTK